MKLSHCFWLISILTFIRTVKGTISVNRVITRIPRDGDIGIMFDINLINIASDKKELLEFRIHAAKECCVNLTESLKTENAGKIVGGSFGTIESGAKRTVSVIWPTTALFNRVGYCDIVISSTNIVSNEEKELLQQLQFDTRFSQIDGTGTTFRKRKKYAECSNWDMDFLNNCTPINCEEKYLGTRNFYNIQTKMCETVPKCFGANMVYDIYANDCIDNNKLMDPEEIESIKRGKNENNTLELAKNTQETQYVQVETKNMNQDFFPGIFHQTREAPMWSEILSGLSLVFATIVIYTLVCFCIFLLVNRLSKISAKQ